MNYVPFLKVKAGELGAVASLTANVRQQVKPYHLFIDDKNADRAGDYLRSLLAPLVKAHSGQGIGFFVDFSIFHDYEIIHVCERMRENILDFTYVVRNARLPENVAAYLKTANLFGNGLAIKLDATERITFDELNERIALLEDYFEIQPGEIDLVLDFSFIPFENIGMYLTIFETIQNNVGRWADFRTVIVIAGSFPRDMNAITVDTVQLLPMHEYRLYNQLLPLSNRDIIYGDYGNIHPLINLEAQNFPGSCTIKYTTEGFFKIFRGTLARLVPEGHGQYITKCNLIVADPDYDGVDFSYGDAQIFLCGRGETKGPGSAQTWIINSLNHHITKMSSLV